VAQRTSLKVRSFWRIHPWCMSPEVPKHPVGTPKCRPHRSSQLAECSLRLIRPPAGF